MQSIFCVNCTLSSCKLYSSSVNCTLSSCIERIFGQESKSFLGKGSIRQIGELSEFYV